MKAVAPRPNRPSAIQSNQGTKHQRQAGKHARGTRTSREKKRAWESAFCDLLDNVKTALKQGWPPNELRDNLKKLDRVVAAHRRSLRSKDELRYLKSQCIMAEAYDYIGDSELAKKAAYEGQEILDQLKKLNANDQIDRKIVRERIRLCLDYAHVLFYRTYKYDEALDTVIWCRDFVIQRLQNQKDFPCFGTLAKAEHNLGRIYMRTNEYEEAEVCFARSIRHYRSRAERMRDELREDRRRLEEELSFSDHKSGICLGLGLGWTNFLRGRLKTALNSNVEPARSLLGRTKDAIHTAYLDLLQGSVERALAGRRKKGELQEAVRIINRAYDVFEKYEHGAYMARAAFELSLAYYHSGDLDEAEAWAAKVEAASEKIRDPRWRCQTSIVRSRIARTLGNHEKAEEIASVALDSAKETNQVLCQIEARIALGEARTLLGRIDDARTDFKEALKLNASPGSDGEKKQANPKIEAVCELHLARCDTRERKVRPAEMHFARWRELRGQIEHEIIHEMALEVEEGIQDLKKDFSIPEHTDNLTYFTRKRELQQWLVERAVSRGATTVQQIADPLNVTRTTIHEWARYSPRLRALLPKSKVKGA